MGTYFSKHAKQRLKERKITQQSVREVIRNATDTSYIDNEKYKCVFIVSNRKRLIVIFHKKGKHIIIITAYYSK